MPTEWAATTSRTPPPSARPSYPPSFSLPLATREDTPTLERRVCIPCTTAEIIMIMLFRAEVHCAALLASMTAHSRTTSTGPSPPSSKRDYAGTVALDNVITAAASLMSSSAPATAMHPSSGSLRRHLRALGAQLAPQASLLLLRPSTLTWRACRQSAHRRSLAALAPCARVRGAGDRAHAVRPHDPARQGIRGIAGGRERRVMCGWGAPQMRASAPEHERAPARCIRHRGQLKFISTRMNAPQNAPQEHYPHLRPPHAHQRRPLAVLPAALEDVSILESLACVRARPSKPSRCFRAESLRLPRNRPSSYGRRRAVLYSREARNPAIAAAGLEQRRTGASLRWDGVEDAAVVTHPLPDARRATRDDSTERLHHAPAAALAPRARAHEPPSPPPRTSSRP
ncbi:hypothetical protein DFH09DRAFT_478081 [Mycena vulgaris]|nr:hypothetical protein DFH09DRAFT_478081 [Mycena vulgaris]